MATTRGNNSTALGRSRVRGSAAPQPEDLERAFYHPPTLGVARPGRQGLDDRIGTQRGEIATHEVWREGIRPFNTDYDRHPEAQVFAALRVAASREHARLWVVLGEPGAGKSHLLNEWFRR